MSYREYNYVGINWTGGIDTTVGKENYDVKPDNETDAAARNHDWAYGLAE